MPERTSALAVWHSDPDGRLADFCRFFLAACIDQVRFMRALLSPEALAGRVREFVPRGGRRPVG